MVLFVKHQEKQEYKELTLKKFVVAKENLLVVFLGIILTNNKKKC
jgi:hypothetical protein